MPIYVYRCQQCNEYTEALQKVSDPLLKTCPHCQADALEKVIAPVGVIFKGTGFHKNDYSGKPASSSTSAPKGEAADTKSGSESTPAGADSSAPSGGSGSSEGGSKSDNGNKVA